MKKLFNRGPAEKNPTKKGLFKRIKKNLKRIKKNSSEENISRENQSRRKKILIVTLSASTIIIIVIITCRPEQIPLQLKDSFWNIAYPTLKGKVNIETAKLLYRKICPKKKPK